MKIPSLKQLTINLIGHRLTGRSYAGTGNSFFSELSARDSDAGILINNETALNYTAFWACVRLLTRTMASLPFIVYERQEPRGKNWATNHPLYRLLHDVSIHALAWRATSHYSILVPLLYMFQSTPSRGGRLSPDTP